MSDQLEFLPKRTKPVRKAASLAEVNPVAQVRIDAPLPHLDRIFDYSIPAALDEQVQSGVRVRVRFAGRLINGVVVGRIAESEAKSLGQSQSLRRQRLRSSQQQQSVSREPLVMYFVQPCRQDMLELKVRLQHERQSPPNSLKKTGHRGIAMCMVVRCYNAQVKVA